MADKQKTTITPAELKARLDEGRVEFMFDLRNEEDFQSWRIEGRTPVETLNISQPDFIGEEEKYLHRFPRDREVVTVCAHGDSSKYTAELLQNEGFNAVGLLGGMDAWSELYETHKVSADSPVVYQIYRVARGCITHIVASGGEAVVIDAVRHTEHIMKVIEENSLKIKYVFDTHLQADHISGGLEIARQTGAPYCINPKDAKGAAYEFSPLEDAMEFKVGSSTLRALHTPGHTPGSVSLILDNKTVFTGDTIMAKSIGRPDLGGMVDQWAGFLFHTLFTRFATLPGDMLVLPTHAASIKEQDQDAVVKTTLGAARGGRDLFQLKDLKAFTARVKETLLVNPDRYKDVRQVNLGLLDPGEDKKKELEIGKNLCGMSGK